MKCKGCKVNYPDDILSSMFIDGGYTHPICGVCALEISNQITGVKRDCFHGEIAEDNRLEAIEHTKSTRQTRKFSLDDCFKRG